MKLSEEQHSAVRWQWWLVGGMLLLVVLAFIGVSLLAGGPIPHLFLILVCGYGGLSNLAIGILSVRYEVTILGRRIKFWEPVEGGMAVFHGWMGIVGGVILIVVGLVLSYESGSSMLVGIYLGGLFAPALIGLIVYGLRRAFADQD